MSFNSPLARGAVAAAVVLGAFATVTVMSAPSAAQVDMRALFEAIDVDGDERVTLAEYAATRDPTIAAVVFNSGGDAALAPADAPEYWFPISRLEDPYEMLSGKPSGDDSDRPAFDPASSPRVLEMRTREFRAFDDDADGAVSYAEYQSRHIGMIEATFARLDVDGDGRLATGELARIPVLLVPPGAPPMSLPVFEREAFEATDRDRNGTLSLEEFAAGPA
jgi:Ca2+-binding EF-hand superfamily protein